MYCAKRSLCRCTCGRKGVLSKGNAGLRGNIVSSLVRVRNGPKGLHFGSSKVSMFCHGRTLIVPSGILKGGLNGGRGRRLLTNSVMPVAMGGGSVLLRISQSLGSIVLHAGRRVGVPSVVKRADRCNNCGLAGTSGCLLTGNRTLRGGLLRDPRNCFVTSVRLASSEGKIVVRGVRDVAPNGTRRLVGTVAPGLRTRTTGVRTTGRRGRRRKHGVRTRFGRTINGRSFRGVKGLGRRKCGPDRRFVGKVNGRRNLSRERARRIVRLFNAGPRRRNRRRERTTHLLSTTRASGFRIVRRVRGRKCQLARRSLAQVHRANIRTGALVTMRGVFKVRNDAGALKSIGLTDAPGPSGDGRVTHPVTDAVGQTFGSLWPGGSKVVSCSRLMRGGVTKRVDSLRFLLTRRRLTRTCRRRVTTGRRRAGGRATER